ncbi:DUF1176 domain-containing protein [Pelagibacterium xiamenense]|uniref:DUF1176 domain-containing protein n=1 Tax=Pelagibacterium xiamenense TaxID=2901140 RepID=UPI001E58C498|nr:DUF1176 domain-containing protein [Pelagibacterium xiamenense]MCD7061134.1 DUF1176 domain-containing protein [Pelagibacterium xiamenense]
MKTTVVLAFSASLIAFPAAGQDTKAVTKLFQTTFQSSCYGIEEDFGTLSETRSWELTWRHDYSDTDSTATLYEFFCDSGAYNANYVYYLVDEYDGALPVAFAVPEFDVVYEDDDFEGDVLDIPITGYGARLVLTNPHFDPETETITSHSLWRGLGDASSSGTWVFDEGRFRLVTYDVDPSYDGEINPERLVDFE